MEAEEGAGEFVFLEVGVYTVFTYQYMSSVRIVKYLVYATAVVIFIIHTVLFPLQATILLSSSAFLFSWINGCWVCLPIIPIIFLAIPILSAFFLSLCISLVVNIIFRSLSMSILIKESVILALILLGSYVANLVIDQALSSATMNIEVINEQYVPSEDSPGKAGTLYVSIQIDNTGNKQVAGHITIKQESVSGPYDEEMFCMGKESENFSIPANASGAIEFECTALKALKVKENYAPQMIVFIDTNEVPLYGERTEKISLSPRNW